jgi:hypothetical protein
LILPKTNNEMPPDLSQVEDPPEFPDKLSENQAARHRRSRSLDVPLAPASPLSRHFLDFLSINSHGALDGRVIAAYLRLASRVGKLPIL